MKIIISLFLIITANYLFSQTRFEIRSSKSEYIESEPLWIEFEIYFDTLKLDTGPFIHPDGGLDFTLTNIDSNKTIEKFWGKALYALTNEPPKYCLYSFKVFNLLGYYNQFCPKVDGNLLYLLPYLPESNYELKASLGITVNGYGNSLYSNKIHFKIRKPEGTEIEEYDSLLGYYSSFSNNLQDHYHLYSKAEEFIQKFPNSVYTEKIQEHSSINFLNPYASLEYYSNLIKNNPENYYNQSYLDMVEYYLRDKKDELIKYLNGIIQDYKGTLLQRFALNKLCEAKLNKRFE